MEAPHRVKRKDWLHGEALEFYEGSVAPTYTNWARMMLARDLAALGERDAARVQAERAYADAPPTQRQSQGIVLETDDDVTVH